MKIIRYKKTGGGIELVSSADTNNISFAGPIVRRYEALFQGVPIHGGQEWKTLSSEELVNLFRQAADQIHDRLQWERNVAVWTHEARSRIVRWWQERRGWSAPAVPSSHAIVMGMANRCVALADWMKEHQYRPFYQGSDMSDFIEKPRTVARRLQGGGW